LKKADTFCRGIEPKKLGRLVTSLLSKPYACEKEPDSKNQRNHLLNISDSQLYIVNLDLKDYATVFFAYKTAL